MLFLVIPMVGSGVIRATGNTAFPSLLMTVAAVVNAILDPLLIFGLAGFPRLELQGAAIATVIARGVTLLASLAVLYFRERLLVFCLPPRQRLLDSWKRILHVSLPAAGSAMVNPISVGITISLLAPFGAEAVAAFGIATRIEAFALIVLLALASSIGPFVGQNWGARQYRRVVAAVRLSSLFSLVWGLLMALLLGINATLIAGVFNDNPDVIAIARLYLLLVPVSYGANGIILLSSAVFNALGKPLPATVITVTRWLILYIPMALTGGYLFGVAGVFAAVCLANFAVGLAAFVWNQKVCRP
jgi:Na+-driven multidrug efflux pump